MKEYVVKLKESERNLTSSASEKINELEMALQIWQDLTVIHANGNSSEEDSLVRNILEQILVSNFGDKDKIPMPAYYKQLLLKK